MLWLRVHKVAMLIDQSYEAPSSFHIMTKSTSSTGRLSKRRVDDPNLNRNDMSIMSNLMETPGSHSLAYSSMPVRKKRRAEEVQPPPLPAMTNPFPVHTPPSTPRRIKTLGEQVMQPSTPRSYVQTVSEDYFSNQKAEMVVIIS